MSAGDKRWMVPLLAIGLFPASAWSAQIYECVAIGGGDFYSEVPCFEHKAIARTRHTVPDGMPFSEQVKLINERTSKAREVATREAASRSRAQECGRVDQELAAMATKYAKGDYVEINEVNRDQARHRHLKSRRMSLGCASE